MAAKLPPISTRSLSRLPGIDELRRLMQSMAMLDAILQPEWQRRYYSFHKSTKWKRGQMFGSMRNGSGDDWWAGFTSAGCVLLGFAHESPMSPFRKSPPEIWPGVVDPVPAAFRALVERKKNEVTFCVWREYSDDAWQVGNIRYPKDGDPDGSEYLLSPLDGDPKTYKKWAEEYYRPEGDDEDDDEDDEDDEDDDLAPGEYDDPDDDDWEVDLGAVESIYAHRPLTDETIKQLNKKLADKRSIAKVHKDAVAIGYPLKASRAVRKKGK